MPDEVSFQRERRRDSRGRPEKRKEPRAPVDGSVRILLDEPVVAEIHGTLMDISASGFRASHGHAALLKGQTVRFWHAAASGQARVVWNRITAGTVETGFLIV
jgi:PilZ domain